MPCTPTKISCSVSGTRVAEYSAKSGVSAGWIGIVRCRPPFALRIRNSRRERSTSSQSSPSSSLRRRPPYAISASSSRSRSGLPGKWRSQSSCRSGWASSRSSSPIVSTSGRASHFLWRSGPCLSSPWRFSGRSLCLAPAVVRAWLDGTITGRSRLWPRGCYLLATFSLLAAATLKSPQRAYPLFVAIDASKLRHGRVRGRYFRENFAQAGIDLSQIIPELVTNADAAIAAAGRERGRIQLGIGPADPEFLRAWKAALRSLRLPALRSWRYELVCSDDGEGVDADVVDQRLGALGVVPEREGQRGLFGRGLRDVWLAQGGGRIQGVRGERAVESWFLPAGGDEPYVYTHVLDTRATRAIRRELGIAHEGSRVTVPLADGRLPPDARLRRLVSDLVQLRPILEDERRELLLDLSGEPLQLVRYTPPEPDPERPVLFDDEIELQRGVTARVVVRRAAQPIPLSPARAARRGGLVVMSGRAAHETTLAGLEARPGARHLYGEVRCEAIERLQREALDTPRPQVVVRVDRSGLNDAHPLVRRLYAALERIVRPIVEAEERRAGARLVRAGKEIAARDEVGSRAGLRSRSRQTQDCRSPSGGARCPTLARVAGRE